MHRTDSPKGRDPMTGRVLPGNTIAAGNKGANPLARRMTELRRLAVEATTEAEVAAVFEKLLGLGLQQGDVAALKVWLEYKVGRPVTQVELTTDDGQTVSATVVMTSVLAALGDFPDARIAVGAAFRRLAIGGQQISEPDITAT
jgi:hypothetical protein